MSAKVKATAAKRRRQHSVSAKVDEAAKQMLARHAAEAGVSQSQIVLNALAGKPTKETPVAAAAREIVALCHDIRRRLQLPQNAGLNESLAVQCDTLVGRLPALFELVRAEQAE